MSSSVNGSVLTKQHVEVSLDETLEPCSSHEGIDKVFVINQNMIMFARKMQMLQWLKYTQMLSIDFYIKPKVYEDLFYKTRPT